jgi:membrane dipeptidase
MTVTDADIQALHHDAVVADTHNDLLMLVSRKPPAEQAAYFRDAWLPQLKAGGVDVQVLPVFIDDDFRPEGALRQTLRMLEAGHRVAEGNADAVALCTNGAEVRRPGGWPDRVDPRARGM